VAKDLHSLCAFTNKTNPTFQHNTLCCPYLTLSSGWMPGHADTQRWGHSTGPVHIPDGPQGR